MKLGCFSEVVFLMLDINRFIERSLGICVELSVHDHKLVFIRIRFSWLIPPFLSGLPKHSCTVLQVIILRENIMQTVLDFS